ncbi:5-(carboxyamino)imidazole ribonucleotide mutase [Hymenobacter taeanensis]|uniref:N5-carboxyaminoimidazole ribonucleotide mutase n=1 Tax=Hymenobacter taeanensis TaxID=2735321 RepID=A0A6M6BKY8_9BACT|nr:MULTISPECIES: 5-(carboxyamino)imidazole ribonucleotide mutase [Hymenobacter]QJX47735.1 5-(carboxyamino)imidazole ribonucleotide mutase [Hymenobacter taeanensis]UOQ82779.1 5-(carboxyamino)imidazole ribonucleotide mutase [Hymenobacter sp. 5414T-23]
MSTTLPASSPADVSPLADTPLVGIVMGSQSDLKIMSAAAEFLRQFNVPYEITLVSPHRTPHRLIEYGETARKRGLRVIIAGGGGAAHLPGMLAAFTTLPVIGVPINSVTSLHGLDSILSMLQMPAGVPVATVALDGAANAAVLATEILAISNARLADVLEKYRTSLKDKVMRTIEELRKGGFSDD